MIESQNVEFKSIWKDEYLRYVCAFANSKGGNLYIGVNDKGIVLGVENIHKLLEDIPNKVIQQLGIYVSVDLILKDGKNMIVIHVKSSPIPICFKGKYYVRSGSTTQEIKGFLLEQFILTRLGKTYDELIAPNADLDEIDTNSLQLFLNKARRNNRINFNAEIDNIEVVLKNLNLLNNQNQLKNAAILLFGKEVKKYFSSVTFRIGRFVKDHQDLKFYDVIEGNLFEMPEKVMDVLKSKYLVSNIQYEGLQRIEQLEYPEEVLREAILNAIIHKDYSGVHTQMSVYDDKIILWNPGQLLSDLTIDQLKEKHPSIPRNRYIADVFFKAGMVETWGRGINKIIQGCSNANLPEPIFEEKANGFQLILQKDLSIKENINVPLNVPLNVPINVPINDRMTTILNELTNQNKLFITELANKLKVSEKTIRRDLSYLKENNLIEFVGSKKAGEWRILPNKLKG